MCRTGELCPGSSVHNILFVGGMARGTCFECMRGSPQNLLCVLCFGCFANLVCALVKLQGEFGEAFGTSAHVLTHLGHLRGRLNDFGRRLNTLPIVFSEGFGDALNGL